MEKSDREMTVGISATACLLFAFSLLILPLKWIVAALFAAIIHEACHALAVFLCGGRIHGLKIGRNGAVMEAGAIPPGRQWICSLAGPLGSGFLVLLIPYLPRVAFCGGVHCLYNLLPLYPLDGGRVLLCLLDKLPSSKRDKVYKIIETVTLSALTVGAVYLCFWLELGWTPVFLAAVMWFRARRNSPCKEDRLGLQ